jgi:hypothetical protein
MNPEPPTAKPFTQRITLGVLAPSLPHQPPRRKEKGLIWNHHSEKKRREGGGRNFQAEKRQMKFSRGKEFADHHHSLRKFRKVRSARLWLCHSSILPVASVY